jgi:hypothetical protein
MYKNAIFIFSFFIFLLFLVEIALRVFGVASTYNEKNNGIFVSYYGTVSKNYYHTWPPNTEIEFKQKEFSYKNKINNLGFREIDLPNKPNDSLDYIFVLGDSFVEGDGAPKDSAMPAFLEILFLKEGFKNVKVFNLGTCGSDAAFNYKVLKDIVLPLNPKLVLTVTNNSDINDFIFRGGLERFDEKNKLVITNKPPNGMFFYKYSRIARLYFHALGYGEGMLPKSTDVSRNLAEEEVVKTLVSIYNECDLNGINSIIVSHAFPNSQILFDDNDKYLEFLDNKLSKNIRHINTENQTKDILVTAPLYYYSWKENAHYNSKGYKMFAEVIFNKILSEHPEVLQNFKK